MTESLLMKLYDLCEKNGCWMSLRPDVNGNKLAVVFDIIDRIPITHPMGHRFAMMIHFDRLEEESGEAYENYVITSFADAIEDVKGKVIF